MQHCPDEAAESGKIKRKGEKPLTMAPFKNVHRIVKTEIARETLLILEACQARTFFGLEWLWL